MAKNPDKQERLRGELKTLQIDSNGLLTPQSFLTAPYLRAFIKETIRVSPIVTGNARRAQKNLVIKGYQIPEGVREC